mgnify:CR=1 FL=1
MTTAYDRITITPDSEVDLQMIKILAKQHKITVSKLGARAIREWLRDNFQSEINIYNQIQNFSEEKL